MRIVLHKDRIDPNDDKVDPELRLQKDNLDSDVVIKKRSVTQNMATSTTITALFPEGALILGWSVRVLTILAGSGVTAVDVGDGTDADMYADDMALVVGTTITPVAATAVDTIRRAAAGNMVFTGVGGTLATGVVRADVWYIDTEAATS